MNVSRTFLLALGVNGAKIHAPWYQETGKLTLLWFLRKTMLKTWLWPKKALILETPSVGYKESFNVSLIIRCRTLLCYSWPDLWWWIIRIQTFECMNLNHFRSAARLWSEQLVDRSENKSKKINNLTTKKTITYLKVFFCECEVCLRFLNLKKDFPLGP